MPPRLRLPVRFAASSLAAAGSRRAVRRRRAAGGNTALLRPRSLHGSARPHGIGDRKRRNDHLERRGRERTASSARHAWRACPRIQDLAVRRRGGAWAAVASNVTPEFRVVSGLRRLTNQQLDPLAGLGVPITQELVDREKWEAFWDAPLYVPGGEAAHNDVTPPQHGVLSQPGLPRQPEEITRAAAVYRTGGCEVTTNGARIEVSFPGVTLGVFSGRLQFTVYRGANLIRQEIIAKTDASSVAYKYDAGLAGLAIGPSSRVLWRGLTNLWQDYHLGSAPSEAPVTLKTSNRIVVAESPAGSIAAFPPPHTFFWARETSYNLGYNWYRKDGPSSFAFGVRQAESEESPEDEGRGTEDRHQNFALLSARPGTWQRMPVYFYVSPASGPETMDGAWKFTHGDHFKPLAGYQVMATHFHMSLLSRARKFGGLDARVPDLEVLKAAGITIVAPIDGGGGFVASQSTGGDPAYNGDDPKWLQWSRGLGAPPEYIVGSRRDASGGHRARPRSRQRRRGNSKHRSLPRPGRLLRSGGAAVRLALRRDAELRDDPRRRHARAWRPRRSVRVASRVLEPGTQARPAAR